MFSQKSYKTKLGTCNQTIAQVGCLLTSCTNLFPRLIDFKMTPPELNTFCVKNGLYSNGCMLNLAGLAKKFNLIYKKDTKSKVCCIAETDHWKSKGVPQHFFLWKPDGTIIDPLDAKPDWKKNPYKIVSYRIFEPIKVEKPKEATEAPKPTEKPVEVNIAPQGVTEVRDIIRGEGVAYTASPNLAKVGEILATSEQTLQEKIQSFFEAIIKFIKK